MTEQSKVLQELHQLDPFSAKDRKAILDACKEQGLTVPESIQRFHKGELQSISGPATHNPIDTPAGNTTRSQTTRSSNTNGPITTQTLQEIQGILKLHPHSREDDWYGFVKWAESKGLKFKTFERCRRKLQEQARKGERDGTYILPSDEVVQKRAQLEEGYKESMSQKA